MYTFLLQDWVTIRSAAAITIINQTAANWLDLSPFQDIVGWIDVKSVTGSGGTVQLSFQSAPTQDDALLIGLWSSLSEASSIPISTPGLSVASMLNNNNNTPTPVSRWLRWQLSITGSPATTWDITFRLFICANAGGGGRAKSFGGMPMAPSMPAGASMGSGASGSIRTGAAAARNPSTPLHLSRTTAPSARAQGALGPRGHSPSVPLHLAHTTPSSSGPHGPVGPGGPSVPLHLKRPR